MAAASAASAWSRTAGNDREPDHPYETTLTSRSRCPGSKMVDTIVRARWGKLSACTRVPGGPSTTWSITTATIRALSRVECTKPARAPREASACSTNGSVNAAVPLGSWPGRDPLGLTAQYPGPEIEAAFMGTQLAVANIERFVVDQQPDDLAVGHINDRLP